MAKLNKISLISKEGQTNDFEIEDAVARKTLSDIKSGTVSAGKASDSDKLGGLEPVAYAKQDNTYTKEQVDNLVSSVYRFKGSVATYDDLPKDEPVGTLKIGDVYDVIDTGINYAWTGEVWDELGGKFNLSDYALKSEVPDITVNNAVNAVTAEQLDGKPAAEYAHYTGTPKEGNTLVWDSTLNDFKPGEGGGKGGGEIKVGGMYSFIKTDPDLPDSAYLPDYGEWELYRIEGDK